MFALSHVVIWHYFSESRHIENRCNIVVLNWLLLIVSVIHSYVCVSSASGHYSASSRLAEYCGVVCCAFSALTLLVGRQKGHLACKKTEWWGAGMVISLERGADLHMPSWCHCDSLSLASVKSRLVLPFWYWPTRVVLEKGPLNGCVCVVWFVSVCLSGSISLELHIQSWPNFGACYLWLWLSSPLAVLSYILYFGLMDDVMLIIIINRFV